jgi:iron complex transport system substrate-binding protein
MHRAVFPQQLTFCGGPVLIRSARMLARARQDALEARG